MFCMSKGVLVGVESLLEIDRAPDVEFSLVYDCCLIYAGLLAVALKRAFFFPPAVA